MAGALRKLTGILTPAERLRAVMLVFLVILMALLEVTGVASIAPFLAVLGNQNIINTSPRLAAIYHRFSFGDPAAFLAFLSIASLVLLVSASFFRAFVLYAKLRYVNMRRHSLCVRLLRKYIWQPYPFFLQRNSSEMSETLLSEIDHLILNAFLPLFDLLSYGAVTLAILTLLLVIKPLLALIVAGVVGGFYALLYWGIRDRMTRLGRERKQANAARFRMTAEVLGGIKELKILGREKAYLDACNTVSRRFSRYQILSQMLTEIPKYAVEAIGFCAVFLTVLYLLHEKMDSGQILPVIGLYVFAGYRLLPAMQSIYSALMKLRFSGPSIDAVYNDLRENPLSPSAGKPAAAPLPLRKSIELRHVCYSYAGIEKPALKDIGFTIPAGTSTGIIGTTGAGKSTLIDLILGLLKPAEGQVLIDGVPLTESNARAWHDNIGYVPQHIFLADDTIARNIAFGISEGMIDTRAVERAARMAQIHDFVSHDLPEGYQTAIGERGVRLSGGQRQRIGIARALYGDPDVIIFDEATSALDQATEAEVMAAIDNLTGHKTIILITHRIETVRRCHMIVRLEAGRTVDIGDSSVLPRSA